MPGPGPVLMSGTVARAPRLFGTGHESLKFDDCGRRCLAVRPRGLALGGAREVVFPAGGAYGDLSGLAGERQAVKLSGLQPFRFPFWYETPPKDRGDVSSGQDGLRRWGLP